VKWVSATWQEENVRLRAHAGKVRLCNWRFSYIRPILSSYTDRQTLLDLHSSYVPEGPAQVEFYVKLGLSAGMFRYVFRLHTRESNLNPDLNTSEPDRPVACVIAQQCSSRTVLSMRFHSLKEHLSACFKNVIISTLFLLF
jgi:hypothetical protein